MTIKRVGLNEADSVQLLARDHRFLELSSLKLPFNMFQSLGIQHHERAHSQVLADLFRPNGRHHFGDRVLSCFLQQLATVEPRFDEIAKEPLGVVEVYVERHGVDVLVALPTRNAVIAIENKIHADEQEGQIARYQRAVAAHYPRCLTDAGFSYILFLTPHRHESTTALRECNVRYVPISYRTVIEALRDALRIAVDVPDEERLFVAQFIAHLEEDVIDDGEIKKAARDIWRQHGKAANLLERYRPRLEDIRTAYETIIRAKIADARFAIHPSKGDLREIKFDIPSWTQRGIPLTFMLYCARDGRPATRLLLWSNEFDQRTEPLRNFAKKANAQLGGAPIRVDSDFKSWNSYWRRVLEEEAYPPESYLDDYGYDGNTAAALADRMLKLHAGLDPIIQEIPVMNLSTRTADPRNAAT